MRHGDYRIGRGYVKRVLPQIYNPYRLDQLCIAAQRIGEECQQRSFDIDTEPAALLPTVTPPGEPPYFGYSAAAASAGDPRT